MEPEGNYRGRDEHQPTAKLARDPFTEALRKFKRNPEAVEASARIDVMDEIEGLTTWNIDLFRKEGEVTALIQIGRQDGGYTRIVMPPSVTNAIARHQAGLVTKQRRKTAKRIVADKKAQGLPVGNPAALAAARKARRKK